MATMKSPLGCHDNTRSDSERIPARHAARLEPDLYRDLLAVRYADRGRDPSDALDCLGLALEVMRRQGYAIPDPTPSDEQFDPRAAGTLIDEGLTAPCWSEIDSPVPGCVVALQKIDGHGHVGVVVDTDDGGHILHTSAITGVVVQGTADLRRLARRGRLRWYLPSDALHGPSLAARLGGCDGSIEAEIAAQGGTEGVTGVGWRVVVVPDPIFRPTERTEGWIPYRPGMTAAEAVAEVGYPAGTLLVAATGYRAPLDPDAPVPEPRDGALVVFGIEWRGTEFLIALAVGLILTAISTVIQLLLAPTLEQPDGAAETASPTFDLSGLRNTARPGLPIQVPYGEHRVAGQIIQASFTVDGGGRSVLYVLVSLGAGPVESIGGLTEDTIFPLTGSAVPDEFEIDGNPASSFEAEVQVRLGSNGQEPIPGFNDVIVNVPYNVTLFQNEPFIHFTQDEIDAFEVILFYPEGLVEIDDGDFDPRTTGHTVTYEPLDGSAAPVSITRNLTRSTRVQFSDLVARVDNLPRGKYKITINRDFNFWPDSDAKDIDKSVLSAVNEITYENLAYPGTALVAWKMVASEQLSGGIPTLTTTMKGRKVWVWDGVSETAPDFGTEPVWTDNPAWCVLDMLLNTVYGGGRVGELTLDDIDLAAFKAWADHCDTLVDDGRGGTTPRGKLDMVFDADTPMWDAVQSVCRSNWAFLLPLGRYITVIVDKAKTPVYAFGRSNTSEFVVRYLGKRTRMNAVDVDFFNEEEDWESDTIVRTDDTALITNNETERRERLSAVGVTRPAQAARLAKYRLNRHQKITKQGQFKCGVEGIHLLPGDVVYVATENLSWDQSGRAILDLTFTSRINIADFITTVAGTDRIVFPYYDTALGREVMHDAEIANGAGSWSPGDTLFFSPSLPGTAVLPKQGVVFLVGTVSTYQRLARITAITTDPDLTRTVKWEEYDEDIYTDDPGDVPTATPRLPHSKDIGAAVTFEVVERNYVNKSGVWTDAIEVYVTGKERDWYQHEVFVAPIPDSRTETSDLPWRSVGVFKGESLVYHGVKRCSVYAVSVVPVAPSGIAPAPRRITAQYIRIDGPQIEPPTMADLKLTGDEANAAELTVRWSEGFWTVSISEQGWDKDWDYVEVRLGETWMGAGLIANKITGPGIWPTFHIPFRSWEGPKLGMILRARGKNGVWSYPLTLDPPVPIFPSPNNASFDMGKTFGTAWSAASSSGTTVAGGNLYLSGSNLTAWWVSDEFSGSASDTLASFIALVGSLDNSSGEQGADGIQWQECNFQWDSEKCNQESWADLELDGDECRSPLTWEEADMDWDSLIPETLTWEGWDYDAIVGITHPAIHGKFQSGSGVSTPTELYGEDFSRKRYGKVMLLFKRPHERYKVYIDEMVHEAIERS